MNIFEQKLILYFWSFKKKTQRRWLWLGLASANNKQLASYAVIVFAQHS